MRAAALLLALLLPACDGWVVVEHPGDRRVPGEQEIAAAPPSEVCPEAACGDLLSGPVPRPACIEASAPAQALLACACDYGTSGCIAECSGDLCLDQRPSADCTACLWAACLDQMGACGATQPHGVTCVIDNGMTFTGCDGQARTTYDEIAVFDGSREFICHAQPTEGDAKMRCPPGTACSVAMSGPPYSLEGTCR